MAPAGKSLLPRGAQLAALSDEKVKAVLVVTDAESRRGTVYAICGLVCGTASLFGCLGVYVYLVMHGHDTAAGVVLGTAVLAVIATMIRGR